MRVLIETIIPGLPVLDAINIQSQLIGQDAKSPVSVMFVDVESLVDFFDLIKKISEKYAQNVMMYYRDLWPEWWPIVLRCPIIEIDNRGPYRSNIITIEV